ncbi:MAG: hypothetical protein AB7T18_17895 [Alphaproteobacteria bacterium]
MSRIGLFAGAGMLALTLAPSVPALAQTVGSPMMGRSPSVSSDVMPRMQAPQNEPSRTETQAAPAPIQPPPMAQPRSREAMGMTEPVRPVGDTPQERRRLDNVANALNGCQAQPTEERRACMRRAMEASTAGQ